MSKALWHLPTSWAWARIRELGEVVSGGTPSTKQAAFWGEEVVWFSPADLTGYQAKYIRRGAKSLSELGLRNCSARVMPAGSVMFSSRAPIGYVAINEVDAATNQGFKSVVPGPAVVNEYLYYYLKASKQLAEERATGTTFKEISGSAFSALPVPVAPLREQHRIVAQIDELFSELDVAKESLTLARAQLKAYRQALLKAAFEGKLTADWRAANPDKLERPEILVDCIRAERDEWYRIEYRDWERRCKEWEAAGRAGPRPTRPEPHVTTSPLRDEEISALPSLPVGWAYTRLSEIAYVSSGLAVSKSRQYEDAVEVPYLRVANVQRGHLDLSHIKTMKVEKSQLPSLALRPLDILFNEGGDRDKLGRGWVWDGAINPCVTQNHVFRATIFGASEGRAKLLSHWGNTVGQDYFEKGGKQTTNLASINKTVLKALPVPVIPPREAEAPFSKIEASLSEVEAAETEIETGLAKVEVLRQSILQRAFSGQLVAQDPTDEPAAALLARLRDEPAPARTRRRKAA